MNVSFAYTVKRFYTITFLFKMIDMLWVIRKDAAPGRMIAGLNAPALAEAG